MYDLGIEFIKWLQQIGAWLLPPMEFSSFLGSERFFLLVMPFLYWCLDTTLGLRVGVMLLLSNGINHTLKLIFHEPRPFWYTREVQAYAFESSFGIPSGHAQNSAAIWGILAEGVKRRWFSILALLVIFIIGMSRLYLAVHFPQDVLFGWLLGALLVGLFLKFERPILDWLNRLSFGKRILTVFSISLALLAAGFLARYALRGWELPQEWIDNASAAFPDEEPIDPFNQRGLITTSGAFFGFAAGAIWIAARGGFSVAGPWMQRIVRFLVGILGTLVFYLGLGSLIPPGETSVAYLASYLIYALIGLWIAGLAPYLFVRLGLAMKRPLPEE